MIIEPPCFKDNCLELEDYLKGYDVAGIFVAYHGAGAGLLPGVRRYATENAKEYSEKGGGKALIDNFAGAFGDAFDSSVHKITDIIGEGSINVGGMEFIITPTDDALYIKKGYSLILTSHYTPEDLKDARIKIDYLGELKEIAAGCGNAEEFKAAVMKKFPGYSGENYLDMTAGFFFGK